jgi:hypothetical protein
MTDRFWFMDEVDMDILNDQRLISMAADYHIDGYSRDEISKLLIKDGYSELEAKSALDVLFPHGIDLSEKINVIKCFKTKKGQFLWCPKYKAIVEHGSCEKISCSHLVSCGDSHINCDYKKDE